MIEISVDTTPDVLNHGSRRRRFRASYFNVKLRDAIALIVPIALALALFAERTAHQRTLIELKQNVLEKRSNKIFDSFMDETFGELGMLVLKDPQEIRLHRLSTEGIELDYVDPKDVLTRFSPRIGEQVPLEFAAQLRGEFTSDKVDDLFSYFAPVPIAVLEFMRNGDVVLLFWGKESSHRYMRVVIHDGVSNKTTKNHGWFRFDTAVIDNLLTKARTTGQTGG
ncbi:hypothetical protein [Paludisphaera borealis]|uniref:Uncharacterized protein n=1 Tax=Paludisphaera borealis TaxID=1387353 RepID=A0A1U7CU72_9BACT|nr:hypothetical protein [Paludisphaera borealis]APW62423.1 hypothetical protein BSF38_03967 [Paludisphaera borealis]